MSSSIQLMRILTLKTFLFRNQQKSLRASAPCTIKFSLQFTGLCKEQRFAGNHHMKSIEESLRGNPRSRARERRRVSERERIEDFCQFYSMPYHWFTEYHVRIADRVDIFPTSKKYHFIGSYDYVEYDSLDEVFEKMNW